MSNDTREVSETASHLLGIARSLEGAGDHLSAYRIYTELQDFSIDTSQQRAKCLFDLGNYADALILFRSIVSKFSVDDIHPWIFTMYGLCISSIGATQQDVELIQPLISQSSVNYPVAVTLFSEIFMHHQMFDKVIEALQPLYTSNNSRLFTLLGCALIKKTLVTTSSAPWLTTPARNSRSRDFTSSSIACSSLNCYGRFGQTLADYFFLQKFAKSHGQVLHVPEWIGELVFDLHNPRYEGGFKKLNMTSDEIIDTVKTRGITFFARSDLFAPGIVRPWDESDYNYARGLFQFRPEIESYCLKVLDSINFLNKEILTIHLRFGDQNTRTKNLSNLVYGREIEIQAARLESPVIYVATDCTASAQEFLGNLNFVTNNIAVEVPSGLRWLIDFYIFTISQAVITHQSSFSYWGCILNRVPLARFKQPDIEGEKFVEFNPKTFTTTKFVI